MISWCHLPPILQRRDEIRAGSSRPGDEGTIRTMSLRPWAWAIDAAAAPRRTRGWRSAGWALKPAPIDVQALSLAWRCSSSLCRSHGWRWDFFDDARSFLSGVARSWRDMERTPMISRRYI